MTNETIGHYASHSGSNTVGWTKDKGFYGDIRKKSKQLKGQPSDLELKIRKEVMDAVDELVTETNQEYSTTKAQSLAEIIQDRLNLLWGEND